MNKKEKQLGMHPATASGQLVKDILFRLLVETGKDSCFQCDGKMTRDNFSVEHKTPWLDSTDPKGLFFDEDNISFSHRRCNFAAKRPSIVTRILPSGMKWCANHGVLPQDQFAPCAGGIGSSKPYCRECRSALDLKHKGRVSRDGRRHRT